MRCSVGAALVCLLCVRAVAAQMSVTFNPVQVAGETQCSTDLPVIVSQGSTSEVDCAHQCMDLLRNDCAGFNYRKNALVCQMFNETTSSHSTIQGCTLYQVGTSNAVRA